jgi:uncharacterized OsmC-like protein
VDIDAELTYEKKRAFFEKIDSRCPISDNLINSTKLVFSVREKERSIYRITAA